VTLLKYVEEKASGRYGHSAKTRRKFITALSSKRLEQQAEARRVKAAAAATAARPAVLAKAAGLDEAFRETVNVSRKRPRSRQAS
jgi:ribosomal protein L28